MNEAIQIIGINPKHGVSDQMLIEFWRRLKLAMIYVGVKLKKGLKYVWDYLKEQDRLAHEHYQALQEAKDQFYAKNYWCIR